MWQASEKWFCLCCERGERLNVSVGEVWVVPWRRGKAAHVIGGGVGGAMKEGKGCTCQWGRCGWCHERGERLHMSVGEVWVVLWRRAILYWNWMLILNVKAGNCWFKMAWSEGVWCEKVASGEIILPVYQIWPVLLLQQEWLQVSFVIQHK